MGKQSTGASKKTRSSNPHCQGKVIYKTPRKAEAEARFTKVKGLWGGAEHPYFCKYCKAWHLTSEASKRNFNYGKNKSRRRSAEARRRGDN